MKLIVGLGNPGSKYKNTRHNAGFLALDYLVDGQDANWSEKFEAEFTELGLNEEKVLLAKPQTFMNLSGKSVAAIVNFYKLTPATDLIVIHDDKDLPFGSIKAAKDSSAAGHNGVKDIIDALGTQDFSRIRIGIETRESDSPIPTDVFVLQPFSDDELSQLNQKIMPEVQQFVRNMIK